MTSRLFSGSRVYKAWAHMRQRCSCPTHSDWASYGGRGITVCPEWSSFSRFLADMGEPLPGTSLDRINNDFGYSKSNCRWATAEEQANNKRNNVRYVFDGRNLTMTQWSRELGIGFTTLQARFINGWSVERALTTPARKYSRRY